MASDDALIYAKVVSSIETRGDQIIVLGSEHGSIRHTVDLEKYQTLPIVLTAPNYESGLERRRQKLLKKNIIRTHGKPPSDYAAMGYELDADSGKST